MSGMKHTRKIISASEHLNDAQGGFYFVSSNLDFAADDRGRIVGLLRVFSGDDAHLMGEKVSFLKRPYGQAASCRVRTIGKIGPGNDLACKERETPSRSIPSATLVTLRWRCPAANDLVKVMVRRKPHRSSRCAGQRRAMAALEQANAAQLPGICSYVPGQRGTRDLS